MATDYANLVPREISSEVIKAATAGSAVLRHARVRQLSAGIQNIPVQSFVASAGFVNANGGQKPATDVEWTAASIVPEEIAATIAIPDDFIEDGQFPIWDEVQEDVVDAMAKTLDLAVLFGTGAPANFPTGGILNGLTAKQGSDGAGTDLYDALNDAMADVEASGLIPSAAVGDVAASRYLRGLRDANGLPVFTNPTAGTPGELLGMPYSKAVYWDNTDADYVVGDFSKLLVGIRQDIRIEFSKHGVLTDGAGAVTVSAFEQDMTLMRAYMRVGVVAPKPKSRKAAGNVVPFATVKGANTV